MNGLVLYRISDRNRTRLIARAAANHKRKTALHFDALCNRRPQLIDVQLNKRTAINCQRHMSATCSPWRSVRVKYCAL